MKSADKHDKIIRAAIKVFADKGFFNARIADIAKEAGVADGTIYLYFNNKYDILLSLFEEEIDKIISEVRKLIDKETDPERMLAAFAHHYLNLLRDNKELVEVLQMELRQSTSFIKEYRKTKFVEYIDIISEIVRQGQQREQFRKDVLPGIAKRAYFGALDEMARHWILQPNPRYSPGEAAEQICSIFLYGLKTK